MPKFEISTSDQQIGKKVKKKFNANNNYDQYCKFCFVFKKTL